jgi:VRR-NUC domain-containing protein/Fanconi-associated nuclease 1-like protein/Fanconi anemia protein nuclease-like protein
MNATARRAQPVLEPFYYLKNFELVLSTILARYADLLSGEESRFITAFPQAAQTSRALLARMVMRCGDLFKLSKLDYLEIGNTPAAAVPLIEAGWVTDRPMLSLEQLQSLLTKAELIRCLSLPRRYADWRKSDLVSMLAAQYPAPRAFAEWCADSTDSVYALLIAPLCERFRLMFFGNYRQSWSEFVTADLKIFNYETVERSSHSRPFQTRVQIDVFERLQECREWLEEGVPLDELIQLIPPVIKDSDWLEDRRQKLLFSIAREFERAGDLTTALAMYLECTHRGARTRAIRLTSRAHDWPAVRSLCLLAQQNPESEAQLQHIRRVLPRANRKLGIPGDTDAAPPVIPEFEILLEGARGAGAIEYQVRDHLARDLTDRNTVRYVENDLITALFGLLCWPAIFAAVPGAFFHDFHSGPADLASGHFYRRRQREFEECFSHLDSERYRQSIWRIYRQKWGIQSPFVRWAAVDKTLLQWALACFPVAHLRLWFEWMVSDVQDNRAGFPDLIQFWPQERQYRMIEVKGPGDRVQDNQRRFLEYCASHRMPVAVCYARWSVAAPS